MLVDSESRATTHASASRTIDATTPRPRATYETEERAGDCKPAAQCRTFIPPLVAVPSLSRKREDAIGESTERAAPKYGAVPATEGGTMPLIRVELFDYRMSDQTSVALIEKLTDALGEATHPGLRSTPG